MKMDMSEIKVTACPRLNSYPRLLDLESEVLPTNLELYVSIIIERTIKLISRETLGPVIINLPNNDGHQT